MKVVYTATRTVTERGQDIMADFLLAKKKGGVEPEEFISGAAVGGDTFLCVTSLLLWPRAVHRICIPDYTHNNQLISLLEIAQGWTTTDIILHETGLLPLERNDYMLDKGGDDYELWGFPSTEHEQVRGSGTWACYRHAVTRKVPITMTPLNGADPWYLSLKVT